MEIHLVHKSVTHTYTLSLSLSLSLSRSLSLILKIIQTPRQMEIHHVHQSATHTYTLFNIHDITDALADVNKSSSSVRCTHTHTYTLSLKLIIIHMPRQMELHQVHQSGTHTNTLFKTLSQIHS